MRMRVSTRRQEMGSDDWAKVVLLVAPWCDAVVLTVPRSLSLRRRLGWTDSLDEPWRSLSVKHADIARTPCGSSVGQATAFWLPTNESTLRVLLRTCPNPFDWLWLNRVPEDIAFLKGTHLVVGVIAHEREVVSQGLSPTQWAAVERAVPQIRELIRS